MAKEPLSQSTVFQQLAARVGALESGGGSIVELGWAVDVALSANIQIHGPALAFNIVFPTGFTGSLAALNQDVFPSSAAVFGIGYRDSAGDHQIGTVTFPSSGSPTFSGGGTMPAGSRRWIKAPSTPVVSLTAFAITLIGTVVT